VAPPVGKPVAESKTRAPSRAAESGIGTAAALFVSDWESGRGATMKHLMRAAEERSIFGFAVPVALILGWLLLSGLFFAAISRPAALHATIEKILAHRELELAPAENASASAARARADDRRASNSRQPPLR
jgi:hypothetical protein